MLETVGGIRMNKVKDIVTAESNVTQKMKPRFKNIGELTQEQLNDPDYSVKQLESLGGDKSPLICSKCHHCR